MILASGSDPGYVEWAEEAVRIIKLGIQHAQVPGEAEDAFLKRAQEVLRLAKADYEELGGYAEDEGEAIGEGTVEEQSGKNAVESGGTGGRGELGVGETGVGETGISAPSRKKLGGGKARH